MPQSTEWDVFDPQQWALSLGMVHVPLFGRFAPQPTYGTHAVLLDGRRASFAISSTDDSSLAFNDDSLAWSWSANLHHTVILDATQQLIFLRRWDSPDVVRKFRLPSRPSGAHQLVRLIEDSPAPRGSDVVLYLLRAFRGIRDALPKDNPLDAIRLFNLCLVAAQAVRESALQNSTIAAARTPADVLSLVAQLDSPFPDLLNSSEASLLGPASRQLPLYSLMDLFLRPERKFNYLLYPHLLLRHASGELFQEAHLSVERTYHQRTFSGFKDVPPPKGSPALGVRFTPPPLARSLVQQSLRLVSQGRSLPSDLCVLDPACGSGVFLLETVRELCSIGFRGTLKLCGFDLSDVSCAMARFCLQEAAIDAAAAGIVITVDVGHCDSLSPETDWGRPDIILMNPPFGAWEQLQEDEKQNVLAILGPTTRRVDKAMAFILKGIRRLPAHGALATVLPAAILETSSGEQWREQLTSEATLRLIGRFEGYSYFKASMVEPAFLLLERRTPEEDIRPEVTVLIAQENEEHRALRALRRFDEATDSDAAGWELFTTDADTFTSASWMPRPQRFSRIIEAMDASDLPRATSLFEVHQGARTGANDVFLVSSSELESYPAQERRYFRLAADNATIKDGKLFPTQFVFFPYDATGLILRDERELQNAVPEFYARKLQPNERALASRAGVDPSKWWALTRERSWQREPGRKLVSTYFGDRGSFAYDDAGAYIVVQGHAWIWKDNPIEQGDPAALGTQALGAGELLSIDFYDTVLPWAYLALFNSLVFEALLMVACPRVQGGQFNLSKRFMDNVALPDLSDSSYVAADILHDLGSVGKALHRGESINVAKLTTVAARAYGISAKWLLSALEE